MIIPYIGSFALGAIVGWLIWTFVHRTTTLTIKAITSLASLAAGGAVLALWPQAEMGQAVLIYPVGALIAIIVLGALNMPDEDAS